jgi:predicted SnoaL-like aldol condensation-catalyzing enzyme
MQTVEPLGDRKSRHQRKSVNGVEQIKNVLKSFKKILATSGLLSYSTIVKGQINPSQAQEKHMSNSSPERNKAIVLEAFETLFNKRDYVAAERFWSPNYIQHSAHIAPGREGLFNLVRSVPETLHYENQLIIAEGDYVIAHGRFTGMGRPAAWIAADVVRFEDGLLKEHWDVLQEEATKAESVSGLPMFGDTFPR